MTRRSFLSALFLAVSASLKAAGDARVRILRLKTGRIETIPVEDYVAAVVPAEIGRAPAAALEAQSVAARSYTFARLGRHRDEGGDLCDGTHCQVFTGLGRVTAESRAASQATRGLVLVQKGRVIAAPFHAVCGGRTARPSDVWDDEENPDLAPVDDDACLVAPGATWTYRLVRRDLPALGSALAFPEVRFLEVFGHDASGRVSMIRLAAPGGRSLVLRGFEFRRHASGLWGWDTVRSTAFEVEETRPAYILTGRGTGHGAGLCQAGAIVRARRGESRDAILGLYYRGTSVRAIDTLAAG